MSDSELTPSKLALRRTVRAQRAARSPEDSASAGHAIAEVALELPRLRQAACVALYVSMPGEPDTAVLLAELRRRGTTVLLPVILDDARLDWAVDDGQLAPGAMPGVSEPAGTRLGPAGLGGAAVVIVPAQAVDTHGVRLGRGGGYYDRALASADPDALVVALVHDDELLDAEDTPVRRESHDRDVHGVITPSRWVFFTLPP